MKILFVSFTDIYGGGEVFLKNIIETSRFNITKLLLSPFGKLTESVKSAENIQGYSRESTFVSLANFTNIIKQANLMNRIINDEKIDVVFLNGRNSYYLSPLIKKNVYKIGVWHGINLRSEFHRRMLTQFAFNNLNKLIVVSSFQKSIIEEVFNNKYSGKISVVRLGVDDESNKQSDKSNGVINILIVARLEKLKGHIDLINAFNKLSTIHNNLTLTIVGDGDEMDMIKDKVKNKGSSNNIEIVGFSNPTEYYKRADIFVLPSYSEAFPLVILEAMSHGLPIVATNVGGIPEAIENGVQGYTFNPGDVNELIDKLNILIQCRETRVQMGQNSRKRFVCEFTKDKMCEEIYRIIEEVVKIE